MCAFGAQVVGLMDGSALAMHAECLLLHSADRNYLETIKTCPNKNITAHQARFYVRAGEALYRKAWRDGATNSERRKVSAPGQSIIEKFLQQRRRTANITDRWLRRRVLLQSRSPQ